ncbi:hypothetical protein BGZ94_008410 [Podila epigama]|nr:hypothetical protein BGZ94_008410 [Podila epigama]
MLLLKVKPSVTEEQAIDILKAVSDLKNQLPDIVQSVHLGTNFASRAKGFTHGFTMIFKDRAALDAYDKSPEHIRVVTEVIRPRIDDVLAVDYDVVDFSSPRLD